MLSSVSRCPATVARRSPQGSGKRHDAVVDVLDGVHGIVLDDGLHGERVVEVDPVRHLLVARVEARIHRLQMGKVVLETAAVGCVRLEAAVVEQMDP